MRRFLAPAFLALLLGSLLSATQDLRPPKPQPQADPAQQDPSQEQRPRRRLQPTSTDKPDKGPRPPKLSPQVLVLSLDGAGNDELRQLYRDEILSEGGFARFFQEGEVAEALVPVNPTLTAPNHISLATGYPPARTGIVGNRFHPPGTPWLGQVSGFDAPIASETLWEAARRQKKKVAVLAWPGADGRDARRRGDWGMTYAGTPDFSSRLVALSRSDFKPAELPAGTPKPESRAPLLAARVELRGAQGETQGLDVLAVAGAGGRKAGDSGYDAVMVLPRPRVGGIKASPPVAAGGWMRLTFFLHAERETCWIKLLAIAPDLSAVRLYIGGSYRTPAYPSELARALENEDLHWPGPPDDLLLPDLGRGPGADLQTWNEQAVRFAEFFGDALRLAAARRDWDLMLGYMPSIDEASHQLLLVDPRQPGFSSQRRDAYTRVRRDIWQTVDGELRRLVGALDLGRTTVVVVSDHGLVPVHTTLDVNARLRDHGLLKASAGAVLAEGTSAFAIGNGGIAHVYLSVPAPSATVPAPSATAAADPATGAGASGPGSVTARLAQLKELFGAWRIGGESPLERVLSRPEAAELGLDHPASGDLILFAREGYSFSGESAPGATDSYPARLYGAHGYLNTHSALRAIYLALGAGIKPGGRPGAVEATDLAQRVAGWLGMAKPEPVPPKR